MKYDNPRWNEQPEKNDQQTHVSSDEEHQIPAATHTPVHATIEDEKRRRRQRIFNQVVITLAFMALAFLGGWFSHQAYSSSFYTASPDSQKYAGLIQQAWGIIDQNYVDRKAVNYKQLSYNAIKSMLNGLGDTGHTRFLTPQDVQAEQQSLSGTFAGIGVYIHQDAKTKDIVITSTISGAPAAAAGLKHGDIITEVNGRNVVDMDFSAVQPLIAGQAGTKIGRASCMERV